MIRLEQRHRVLDDRCVGVGEHHRPERPRPDAAELDDALAQFTRVQRLYPRSEWVPRALYASGLVHRKAGRFADARARLAACGAETATFRPADAAGGRGDPSHQAHYSIVIGGVVIAMYLPIFKLVTVVGR